MVFDPASPARPLVGGVRIVNPLALTSLGRRQFGTAACVATGNDGNAYLLSSFHVLCGQDSVYAKQEPVYQPDDSTPANLIARVTAWDEARDCAIALLEPGVAWSLEVLGIGPLGTVADPVRGMPVIKCGAASGVTRGVIDSINGTRVTIVPGSLSANNASLSRGGDSGSLWITEATSHPVAMHSTGNVPGAKIEAIATSLPSVLAALGLELVQANPGS